MCRQYDPHTGLCFSNATLSPSGRDPVTHFCRGDKTCSHYDYDKYSYNRTNDHYRKRKRK